MTTATAATAFASLPLAFEPNAGQTDRSVDFLAHGAGFGVWLTRGGLTLELPQPAALPSGNGSTSPDNSHPASKAATRPSNAKVKPVPPKPAPVDPSTFARGGALPQQGAGPRDVVVMHLTGGGAADAGAGEQRLPGTVNYIVGDDPAGWHSDMPTYAAVVYHNVYPGIDLMYTGANGQLEFTFIVAPNADPGRIHLSYAGVDGISIDKGDLLLHLPGGITLREHAPRLSQNVGGSNHGVSGAFAIASDHSISFSVGGYDHSRSLTIDPVFGFAALLGGAPYAIALDPLGNVYLAGIAGATFPTTPGVVQPNPPTTSGWELAFVTKMNPQASALVYSTYLGGTGVRTQIPNINANAIAVDSSGDAFVTGVATLGFPTTANAFVRHGSAGGFATELNPSGSHLLYSTYLGIESTNTSYLRTYGAGCGTILGNGIAVNHGVMYVTGITGCPVYPVTPGAFQTQMGCGPDPVVNACFDAFVTAIDTAKSGQKSLMYSTLLGGGNSTTCGSSTGYDGVGKGIAVDSAGDAYVTGLTAAASFPVTAGALQTARLNPNGGFSSCTSGFVTKLNPTGTGLVYSTYLGGSGTDSGSGIAVDSAGDAYITGTTSSVDFATTGNAYQRSAQMCTGTNEAANRVFLSKLNRQGSALLYSSFLGGSGRFDVSNAIAIDGYGDAFVTGATNSIDFPQTSDAFPVQPEPWSMAFAAEFATSRSGTQSLAFSTLYASTQGTGFAIAADNSGAAYVAGSSGYPPVTTTAGAYGAAANLLGGGYIVKLLSGTVPPPAPPTQGDVTTLSGRPIIGWQTDPFHPRQLAMHGSHIYAATAECNDIVDFDTATGSLTTLAGQGPDSGYSGDGGPATKALLDFDNNGTDFPYLLGNLATDSAGNVYIADTYNCRIRKVDVTTGIITTVAGNGACQDAGDGTAATQASIFDPSGITVDSAGNLYIAEANSPFYYFGDVIRRVDHLTGNITTIAGTAGYCGSTGDGGPAVSAQLCQPAGMATDSAGDLFIADTSNNEIREVTPAGTITTVAGNPSATSIGDGGPALSASLWGPAAVALDSSGVLYIADYLNDRVRRVGTDGIISSVAGPGTNAPVRNPAGIALDANSNLFYTDASSRGGQTVLREVTQSGGSAVVHGALTSAPPQAPAYSLLAVDASGDLFLSNGSHIIRHDAHTGVTSDFAGNDDPSYGNTSDGRSIQDLGIPGPAASAVFTAESAIVDRAGDLVVSDTYNHAVYKISPAGTISVVAGNGSYGSSGDGGSATNASITDPSTPAVDGAGNVYIADPPHEVIRKVATSGIISTVVGMTDSYGSSGDGGPATSAHLNWPMSPTVDAQGNLYFSDGNNARVRFVCMQSTPCQAIGGQTVPSGDIITVVGNGTPGFSGEGGPATQAEIQQQDYVVQANGGLYLADGNNDNGVVACQIRYVNAAGTINSIAGDGSCWPNGDGTTEGDGGPALSASLGYLYQLAVDGSGNVYFENGYNNYVREVLNPVLP